MHLRIRILYVKYQLIQLPIKYMHLRIRLLKKKKKDSKPKQTKSDHHDFLDKNLRRWNLILKLHVCSLIPKTFQDIAYCPYFCYIIRSCTCSFLNRREREKKKEKKKTVHVFSRTLPSVFEVIKGVMGIPTDLLHSLLVNKNYTIGKYIVRQFVIKNIYTLFVSLYLSRLKS